MAPAVSGTKKSAVAKADQAKKMRQFATGLRKYVQENADYVGPDFAEEARKIHYEEAEARSIRGRATKDEAVALTKLLHDPPLVPVQQHRVPVPANLWTSIKV